MLNGGEIHGSANLPETELSNVPLPGRRHRRPHTTLLSMDAFEPGAGRASPTHHSPPTRSPSKHTPNATLSSAKRLRTLSTQEHTDDAGKDASRRHSDTHRRHYRPRRLDVKRVVSTGDYALGLLDDPTPIDPLLQAQVAELQRRVQNLNPLDFPLLPDSKSITSHSPVSQPPPPTQYPETIESPPRMPSNGHSLGEHTNNHDDVGLQGRANTNSNRRRLSSLFSDVKGKVTGKARESSPRSPPSREDPNKILRDLQAENRILQYREKLRPSTKERAEATKAQLGLRYRIIYEALDKRTRPPSLVEVVKWRKAMTDLRRADSRKSIAAEKGDPMRSPASLSLRLPGAIRSPGALGTIIEVPLGYARESAQLQWLPYLASLYQKFQSPAAGRKEVKDWHVTAQVVAEYVNRDQTRYYEDIHHTDRARSIESVVTPSVGGSRQRIRQSPKTAPSDIPRLTSLDLEISSYRGSMDPELTKPQVTSQRSSVRGFRMSLSGLRELQLGSRHNTFGPSSPVLHHDFSPSSSRRDLDYMRRRRTHLSDDAESFDLSPSDGVLTDTDPRPIPFKLEQSTSDEDSKGKPRLPAVSRSSSMRWPLFGRMTAATPAAEESHDSVNVSSNVDAPEPPLVPTDYHAYTADLVSYFPRLRTPSPSLHRIDMEEAGQRQRDMYARRAGVLERVKAHNAHLAQITQTAVEQFVDFLQARKYMLRILGGEDDQNSFDVLNAFAPFSDSQVQGWRRTEAAHDHRHQNLELLQDFMSEARRHRVPWLCPMDVDDHRDAISSLMDGTSQLEKDWQAVNEKLEQLRRTQVAISGLMGKMQPVYDTAAMQIDTSYPELGRNVDLARQLSVTGQTTLPYISSLPPWAGEVLGPFIEYTLEFVGFTIRWLLYPIWRLLPRWIQVTIAFVAVVILSLILMAISLLRRYWNLSVSVGRFLSRFAFFRYPVLAVIFLLSTFVSFTRQHLKSVTISVSLAVFWYITTPQDLD